MSKHRNKHKHRANPLEKIGKFIMATLNELLADIDTILKGNATDPAVLAKVEALIAQSVANGEKLVANDANDAESKKINADQQVLIEALITKLKNMPSSTSPVVSGIPSSTGSVNGGETVILTGSGFTGVTAVNFGTVAASSFNVTSDTGMTAVAPALPAGMVNVTVITPAGTSTVGTANEYTAS